MSQNPKKTNWFLILTVIGTLLTAGGVVATLITVPEFRCFLLGWSCLPEFQDVKLLTQTETGESLAGVKVQVMSIDAPIVSYTDDNGYVKVQIESKGDVRINLSKSGYPHS